MVTRKTQYAWMAAGGLLCLFVMVLACKLRDGNRAAAQADGPPTVKDSDEHKPVQFDFFVGGAKAESKDADKKEPDKKPEAKDTAPPMPPPPPTTGAEVPKPSTEFLPPPMGLKHAPPPTSGTALVPPPPSSPGSPPPAGEPRSVLLPPPAGTPEMGTFAPPSSPKPPRFEIGGTGIMPASSPPPAPKADKNKSEEKKEERTTGPAAPPAPPHGGPPSAPPSWTSPGRPMPVGSSEQSEPEARTLPGEPPLAPVVGPVQMYQVRSAETLQDIARRTLGSGSRWSDIHRLNPTLKPDVALKPGSVVRLPGDACVQGDEPEGVHPLPAMRPRSAPAKARTLLPLTGTYPCNLDDKKAMTLPRGIREQIGGDTVLVSPGPDQCLWLTDQTHLERLAERLEQSPAREVDVRVFKRLYYAQTEKAPLSTEGRVTIPERLAQFADLHQEVILVGIDDHFEVWDAARWRQYTQQKSAAPRSQTVSAEHE